MLVSLIYENKETMKIGKEGQSKSSMIARFTPYSRVLRPPELALYVQALREVSPRN